MTSAHRLFGFTLNSKLPASILEFSDPLADLIEGIFFANDLKNDIVHCIRGFDRLSQPLKIHHPSAYRIVTPFLKTGVGDMQKPDRGVAREETRYGIFTDIGAFATS
jgi:hypothetical protein